jgi:FixJ family two-component response regulator
MRVGIGTSMMLGKPAAEPSPGMSHAPLVYVVDDDPHLRKSLHMLLKSVAIEVEEFESADDFLRRLEVLPDRPVCLLLDVRMPGMSGMALFERLRERDVPLPTILLTGHGDIDMAVRAMKLGAADFLTKPFGSQMLLDRVQEVLRRSREPAPASEISAEEAIARWQTLSQREKEVFERIVAGAPNKVIAAELDISVRTVESHRARVMEKMGTRSLVDLVFLSVKLKSAQPV